MIELTREVRFSLIDEAGESSTTVTNSWAGWPTGTQLAPYVIIRCTVRGDVDPMAGYLINIREIDNAVRGQLIKGFQQRWTNHTIEQLALWAFQTLSDRLENQAELVSLNLRATPFLNVTVSEEGLPMIQLTQQFEFSASHRLHNPELSGEDNLKLYGKCNNPHGHGHNYVVDVTLQGTPGPAGQLIPLHEFETTVKRTVIDPLDHKYLNIETAEFQNVNPSVENIAIVIFERLQKHFSEPALKTVRVYETPKTWAEYSGQA